MSNFEEKAYVERKIQTTEENIARDNARIVELRDMVSRGLGNNNVWSEINRLERKQRNRQRNLTQKLPQQRDRAGQRDSNRKMVGVMFERGVAGHIPLPPELGDKIIEQADDGEARRARVDLENQQRKREKEARIQAEREVKRRIQMVIIEQERREAEARRKAKLERQQWEMEEDARRKMEAEEDRREARRRESEGYRVYRG